MGSPLKGLFTPASTAGRSSIFYQPPRQAPDLAPPTEEESYIGRASRYLQNAQDFIGGPKQAIDLGVGLGSDYLKQRGIDLGIDTDRGNEAGQLLANTVGFKAPREEDYAAFRKYAPGLAPYAEAVGGGLEGVIDKGSALATDPTLALIPESRVIGAAFLPGILRGAGEQLGEAGAEFGAGNYREAARHAAGGLVDTGFGLLAGTHALGRRGVGIEDANRLAPSEQPAATGLRRPEFAEGATVQPEGQPAPDLGYGRGGAPVNRPDPNIKGVDLTADEAARIQQALANAQAAQQAPPQPPGAPPVGAPVEPPAPVVPSGQSAQVDNISGRDTAEVGRLARMLPEMADEGLAKRLQFYESKGLQQSADAVRGEIQRRQPAAPQPVAVEPEAPQVAPEGQTAAPVAPDTEAPQIVVPDEPQAAEVLPAQGEQAANPARTYEDVLATLPPEQAAVIHAERERVRTTDHLTGLKNKAGWEDIKKSWRPEDHAVAIDLEKFKAVNDLIGHDAGDRVLADVAGLVQKHFGEETARPGGDEFMALLRDASPEVAQARADAFSADLANITHTLEGPNGERIDIPALRAHIGLARDAREADLLSNAARARKSAERAAREQNVPDLGGSERGAAPLPEAGLQDRSPQLSEQPQPLIAPDANKGSPAEQPTSVSFEPEPKVSEPIAQEPKLPAEPPAVTADHVRAAFPTGEVAEREGGYTVSLPKGREIRVDHAGEIEYDPAVFHAAHPEAEPGAKPAGSYRRVDRAGVISLAKTADEGVLNHEVFHSAMDLALTPKEREAVLRHYKNEEAAADAYSKWTPKVPNTLFSKVLSFFRNIYRSFRPSWESAFEATRSGEAYERAVEPVASETKFATAPKAPPQMPRKLAPIPDRPESIKEQPSDRAEPIKPLGRPMRPEEAHRVDTKVANLKEVAPNVKLSRDAPRTWESLDKEIRGRLEDIAGDADKEADFYTRAASGKLNDVDVQTLDALVRGKREAYESVSDRLAKAKDEGRDTGPDNVHLLSAALDRAAAELAVAAKSDVQAGTRLARALAARARVMEAAGKSTPDQFLRRVFKEIPGTTEAQAAELVKIMTDRPLELPDALRALTKPSFFRKWLEFYKAGLLSGIPTHVANTVGNSLEQSVRLAETATAAGVEKLIAKGPRERFIGEAGSELAGAGRAIGPAFTNLAKAAKDIFTLQPEALKESVKFDHQVGAIAGKKGRAIRIPFRLLDAADQYFKEVGGEAEIGKLAYRKAATELRNAPKEVIQKRALKIAEEVRSENSEQHADIVSAVAESRKERTYQQDPGEIANTFLRLSQRHPILQLIAPFVRTPTNLAKAAIARSPLGLIDAAKAMREYRAGKITSGAAADRIARPLLGTAIFATAYGVARGIAPGVGMTGSGPVDPRENSLWKDTGAQPYSFVIEHEGGKKTYVPFSRFEPLSTAFGVVADLAETKDQKNATDAASKVIGTIGNNLTNKTFLQGVTDFAAMVKNPTEFAGQYLRNFAGSLVPTIVAKGAQAIDPKVRDTRAESTGPLGLLQGAKNQIESRLPGASTLLPERKSLTGETIERPGNAFSRFVSPVQVSETKAGTELEQLLVRIGYPPSAPKRDVTLPIQGGRPSVQLHLSDEEYDTLRVAQKKAADFVRRNYLKNPQFQRLPDTIEEGGQQSKEAYIKKVFDKVHSDSRRRLYAIPSFKMRATEARRAILSESKART